MMPNQKGGPNIRGIIATGSVCLMFAALGSTAVHVAASRDFDKKLVEITAAYETRMTASENRLKSEINKRNNEIIGLKRDVGNLRREISEIRRIAKASHAGSKAAVDLAEIAKQALEWSEPVIPVDVKRRNY